MRKAAGALILIGLLIFLYPYAERTYSWYCQRRLVREWESSLPAAGGDAGASPGSDAAAGPAAASEPARPVQSIALLEIAKINLKLPVLRGTGAANLRVGAGLLEDTAEIGAPGNTVLTAHRSHTYGRLFNRLDELAAGDEVTVTTRDNIYRYTVTGTLIVEPDAISVTLGEEDEYRLTLITCHPVFNPTRRLIIRARLKTDDA